ncbi:hypothetical protein LL999_22760 [Burkholderia ambifaria]|uniref:hypothetical protein n=1 Tax=Burkholderia ambifaria TaxID=152480 RepID=UPI001E48EA54|nr:hypothetical protein [Burkholderia ambifaria]UEP23073.1 hypothetical protein LL999_22760 [Burkholderia ambifaria]
MNFLDNDDGEQRRLRDAGACLPKEHTDALQAMRARPEPIVECLIGCTAYHSSSLRKLVRVLSAPSTPDARQMTMQSPGHSINEEAGTCAADGGGAAHTLNRGTIDDALVDRLIECMAYRSTRSRDVRRAIRSGKDAGDGGRR